MAIVYLHIGRGRTGTTSIQRFLGANRSALLERKVHFIGAAGGSRGVGQPEFAKSFISELPGYMIPARKPEEARAAVAKEIGRAKADTILLSSENLELADVPAVRKFFDSLPSVSEVRIMLFARSQDEMAESEYNQMVKVGHVDGPFSEFLQYGLKGYDFLATARDWAEHFGAENLVCDVYDAASDSIDQFMKMVPELADWKLATSAKRIARANESMGFRALTVTRMMNATPKSSDVTKLAKTKSGVSFLNHSRIALSLKLRQRRWLYRHIADSLKSVDFPALMLSSDEARVFRQRFSESNRAFTQQFMGETKDDLGGRRYSDARRDEIRRMIEQMQLEPRLQMVESDNVTQAS